MVGRWRRRVDRAVPVGLVLYITTSHRNKKTKATLAAAAVQCFLRWGKLIVWLVWGLGVSTFSTANRLILTMRGFENAMPFFSGEGLEGFTALPF